MAEITILDGGMGQELLKRSGDAPTPLWSTGVMLDRPGLVAEVHQAYAQAGAKVATTNTYAIHRDRLQGGDSNHYAGDGVDMPDMEDQFQALMDAALTEADAVRGTCRIAGSIGPLKASYRADLHPDEATATPIYAEVAKLLAPRVDVLLFETIPSVEAARACLAAGRQTDKPVWLSFTVDDEDGSKLRSGEPLVEAAKVAAGADAALANCSTPEAMLAALDALATSGRPYGAYANGFSTLTKSFVKGGATASVLKTREDLTPEVYARHALTWADHGATILGGCCEVGPDHISELVARLKAAGHTLAA